MQLDIQAGPAKSPRPLDRETPLEVVTAKFSLALRPHPALLHLQTGRRAPASSPKMLPERPRTNDPRIPPSLHSATGLHLAKWRLPARAQGRQSTRFPAGSTAHSTRLQPAASHLPPPG